MSDTQTLARLRWRSRRGMLELDVILERFIEQRLERLDVAGLVAYERLLAAQDHDLLAWLLKGGPVPDPELRAIVRQIRSVPAA